MLTQAKNLSQAAFEVAAAAQVGIRAGSSTEPAPVLARLPEMADQAERICDAVECFIARFHGEQPGDPTASIQAGHHAAQIDRLSYALARLEARANALSMIG